MKKGENICIMYRYIRTRESYNEEEKNFILKIVKLIRDSNENLEIKLLEKNRDLRIEYLIIEKI